jgi:hypothetical protein
MASQTNDRPKAASGAPTRRTVVSMSLAAGVAAASGAVARAQPAGKVDPKQERWSVADRQPAAHAAARRHHGDAVDPGGRKWPFHRRQGRR